MSRQSRPVYREQTAVDVICILVLLTLIAIVATRYVVQKFEDETHSEAS